MTEAEWLACRDAHTLEAWLPASWRKRRLYAAACVRRVSHLLNDAGRAAVETAERFADGEATEAELVALLMLPGRAFVPEVRYDPADRSLYIKYQSTKDSQDAVQALLAPPHSGCHMCGRGMNSSLYSGIVVYECQMCPDVRRCPLNQTARFLRLSSAVASTSWDVGFRAESAEQAELLQDVVGNPFRPVVFAPAWRTDTAVALARQMYDARDFGAMPILADALQDAGCDNEPVLTHCREPRAHVRGCWVCDAVLGMA
jgi:hypothetical protein